ARRSLCEDALLKIKGVISFTFQMTVKRCVVRIRSDLKAEALGTAIASTKIMKAQQIVKGEDGDEVRELLYIQVIPFRFDNGTSFNCCNSLNYVVPNVIHPKLVINAILLSLGC
ncbi:UNVERIFIED_CONTAM: hypothetical protein FKN15_001488, partial [Acipenser sinensis]